MSLKKILLSESSRVYTEEELENYKQSLFDRAKTSQKFQKYTEEEIEEITDAYIEAQINADDIKVVKSKYENFEYNMGSNNKRGRFKKIKSKSELTKGDKIIYPKKGNEQGIMRNGIPVLLTYTAKESDHDRISVSENGKGGGSIFWDACYKLIN